MITCWNCRMQYSDSRSGAHDDVFCPGCGARPREVRKSLFVAVAENLRGPQLRQFMEDARTLTDDLSVALIEYIAAPDKRLRVDTSRRRR